jgi:hypothetical protein
MKPYAPAAQADPVLLFIVAALERRPWLSAEENCLAPERALPQLTCHYDFRKLPEELNLAALSQRRQQHIDRS